MTTNQKVSMLLPVGRMVGGDAYNKKTQDAEGKPLVYKNGTKAGQLRDEWYIAIAIPKTPGVTHWAHEKSINPKIGDWGAKIWAAAHGFWPTGQANAPTFAFKITDGDSQIPNKRNKKPCDQEGYRGHWVLHMASGWPPKIVDAAGTAVITEPGALKAGYYIQPFINVTSNGSQSQPGIHLNFEAVALSGYGPEITFGPDIASMGFGGEALPPGASATPVGGMLPPASPGVPAGAAMPGQVALPGQVPGQAAQMPGVVTPGAVALPGQAVAMPGVPGQAVAMPGVPGQAVAMPGVPGAVAQPNQAFVQGAVAAAPGQVPPMPGAVAQQPQYQMTTAANGNTREAMNAAGWSDDMMLQHGMMVRVA